MLKLLPLLIAICMLFVACEGKPKSVTACNRSFTAQIKVIYSEKQYNYKLRYNNNGKCEFIPLNKTVPIKFSYENGCWKTSNNQIDYEFNNYENLVPAVIKSVIDNTKGQVIVPDYNEKYSHYGSSAFGEYKAELDSSGNINKIYVGNILYCEFKGGA